MLLSNGALDLDDFYFDTVHGSQDRRRDDILGRSGIGEPTPVQDRHAQGATKAWSGSWVDEMTAMPRLGEGLDLRQYAHLVAEVEAGGGLIHHQHLWFLRQRAGDQRKLALAALTSVYGRSARLSMLRSRKQFIRRFSVSR